MRRIVDLTMVLEEGMQTFGAPWHPYVEITQLGRHGIENRETRKITLGTHTGTHIDAPRHFIPKGGTVEHIPLDVLVGPATVIDFSAQAPKSEVDTPLLRDRVAGRSVERLVLRFDWDLQLNTNAYYSDQPFLSEAACQWLVDAGCRLLAFDVAQPDNPLNGRSAEKDAPNHKILLGAGVVLVEYLVNLRALTRDQIELVVAPLKIKDGDGAPARCFAIEE